MTKVFGRETRWAAKEAFATVSEHRAFEGLEDGKRVGGEIK